MQQDVKDALIHIVIAAAVGALVTFLSQLLSGLTGLHVSDASSTLGGASSTITYMYRALR